MIFPSIWTAFHFTVIELCFPSVSSWAAFPGYISCAVFPLVTLRWVWTSEGQLDTDQWPLSRHDRFTKAPLNSLAFTGDGNSQVYVRTLTCSHQTRHEGWGWSSHNFDESWQVSILRSHCVLWKSKWSSAMFIRDRSERCLGGPD